MIEALLLLVRREVHRFISGIHVIYLPKNVAIKGVCSHWLGIRFDENVSRTDLFDAAVCRRVALVFMAAVNERALHGTLER